MDIMKQDLTIISELFLGICSIDHSLVLGQTCTTKNALENRFILGEVGEM
jgi:hypothetical protein